MELVDAGLDLSWDKAWIFWVVFGVLGTAIIGATVWSLVKERNETEDYAGVMLVAVLLVVFYLIALGSTLFFLQGNHDNSIKTKTLERLHSYYGLEPKTISEDDYLFIKEKEGKLYELTALLPQDGSLKKEHLGVLFRDDKITIYSVSDDGALTELPKATASER